MYTNYLINQVNAWNQNKKCDFEWEFSAPLHKAKINATDIANPEAVQVMLIWDNQLLYEGGVSYNQFGMIESDNTSTDNFELYFLLPSFLDLNNFNETKGHPIEEGRVFELERLLGCLRGDNSHNNIMLDLCALMSSEYQLTRWNVYSVEENIYDNNYIGFRVQVSLRKLS